MAFFKRKPKIIPNYNTVPSKDGPVIDVFSLDGEGFNTINADDAYLFLSGMSYWNMEVKAYGCDYDVNVARNNSSRFFLKLWENKYYEKQPLIGWYIALYSVFHENTWSEISRDAMKVFCESFFSPSIMNTQELWYVSMMYTSLCGGSIDDVVGWLHNLLQALLSQRKITDGTSMVVPVLKHYKTLQGIVHSVPFTTPETGGTLADYWDYIAHKYMCKEAALEAAFIRIFLAHDPYCSRLEANDYDDPFLNVERRAASRGISEDAAYFNSEARNNNLLALSVVRDTHWLYESFHNKLKYPSFEGIVQNYDDVVRRDRETIFQNIYSEAKAKATRIVAVGNALKEADEHYAKGLYLYSIGKSLREEMHQAQKFAKTYRGIKLPEGRLNPGIRRTVWLYHVCKEESDLITQQDIKDIYKIERLAIGLNNKPDEIKFRNLGKLLADGFMGMHPQPQFWEDLRTKAFGAAKDFGIAKYVLDEEPDMAKALFEGVIENSDGKYTEKHIAAAWLGLAWLRWSAKDYSDLSEALEFVSKDEIIEGRFGKDFVTSNVAKAKNNQHKALETLAELYCTHKEISRNDPVIKDVGKLFAYRLTDVKIPHMEKIVDRRDKLEFMTAMVQKEMDFAGYSERLLDYIIKGLDCGLDYFFSLLENSEIYKQVYYAVDLETMLSFLSRAVNSGYNLTKQKNKVQDLINEIELAQVHEESRRENASKPKVSSPKRDDDIPSVVDIIMDGLERKINEDGMTNEELYNRGMRSEMDRETDKRLRDFLKNPLK